MRSDTLIRFTSLLGTLPDLPVDGARILDIGCGAAQCATALQKRYPGALLYGVDYDIQALRTTPHAVKRIAADACALPFARCSARHSGLFGLIIIRHPNVDRAPVAWQQVIRAAPAYLCDSPASRLMLTCYSASEADRVRGWLRELPLHSALITASEAGLAIPDRVGHDRFAFVCRVTSSAPSPSPSPEGEGS